MNELSPRKNLHFDGANLRYIQKQQDEREFWAIDSFVSLCSKMEDRPHKRVKKASAVNMLNIFCLDNINKQENACHIKG